eukprot:3306933-Pleurochrysis_carterae.AAC.1
MGRSRHDRACRIKVHECDVRDSRGVGLFAQLESTMSEKPIRVNQRKRDASRSRKEVEFGDRLNRSSQSVFTRAHQRSGSSKVGEQLDAFSSNASPLRWRARPA